MNAERKVLVTGAAGYIGSVLTSYLLRAGYHVVGVDNLMYQNGSAVMPYLGRHDFEFHNVSITEFDRVSELARDCYGVIPLAAIVGAPACDKKPGLAVAVNHWAVQNLVRNLWPYQRIVYPNTNSGYGETDGTKECTEDDPLTPISVYGKSKCDAEKVVLEHPMGVAFRLATVFGASPRMRMDLMVNDFTHRVLRVNESRTTHNNKNTYFEIYEPHFKRNFVHIRDVCRAFVYALDNAKLRGAYNLGLPTANLTKMELAHRICDVLGVSREVVKVGDGRDPDRRNYVVSNDKILATGFQFRHGLDDGISEVAQVCRLLTYPELEKARNV